MKLLITGASSYVGAKFYSELKQKHDVIGTYNATKLFPELLHLDLSQKEEIFKIIQQEKPLVIIHVAANASAAWCDQNPTYATQLNENATKHLVDAANTINAKIIYISSFAAITPTTLYSKTKANSETLVKQTKAGWLILQPSLILGLSPNTTNDRPFNRILKNITQKTLAVYDTSWKFQATYLKHLTQVLEQCITRNIYGEVIPVAIPELKSRYDFAKDILQDFNIIAKGEDKRDTSPIFEDTLSKIKELKLPECTYNQMINEIKQEIKNYLTIK